MAKKMYFPLGKAKIVHKTERKMKAIKKDFTKKTH